MKKTMFIAGMMSGVLAASVATAQSYDPNYPSNVSPGYYGYNQQPRHTKAKDDFKKYSIGFDYVMGSTGMVNKDVVMSEPLPGGGAYTARTSNFEDSIDSLNGNVGWRPFKYFGLEAFYQHSLSEEEVKHRISYAGYPLFAQAEYNVKYTAYGLDAVFYVPLASRMELLASVGAANYDFKADVKLNAYNQSTATLDSSNPLRFDDSKLAFRYGAGMQLWLSQRLAFRAMYRYTSIGGDYFDDISEIALGVRYNF